MWNSGMVCCHRTGLGNNFVAYGQAWKTTCCIWTGHGKQLCCIWTGLGNNFVAYGQAWETTLLHMDRPWETTLLHMDRPGKQLCCIWTGLGKQLCCIQTGLSIHNKVVSHACNSYSCCTQAFPLTAHEMGGRCTVFHLGLFAWGGGGGGIVCKALPIFHSLDTHTYMYL